LAIDEYGAAKILASGGEFVGRNKTIDNGLDGRPLLRGKKRQEPDWATSGALVAPGWNGRPPFINVARAPLESRMSAVAVAAMTSRRLRGGAKGPSLSAGVKYRQ